jgi:hypothetical protein
LPYQFQPEDFWQFSETAMKAKEEMQDDESRNEIFNLLDKLENKFYHSNTQPEERLIIRDLKAELGKLVYNGDQKIFNIKKLLNLDKDTDYCMNYMPYIRKLAEAQKLYLSTKGHVDPMNVIKGLNYQNTDLAAAIVANKEIMISGEYYAFSVKDYLEPMKEALLEK